MNIADVFLMLALLAPAPLAAQTAASNPCADLAGRTTHAPDVIDRDVEAFDANGDRSIDAAEFREYLLTCDRGIAQLPTPEAREERIFERSYEIVETYPGSVQARESPREGPLLERAPISIVKAYAQTIDRMLPYSSPQPPSPGSDAKPKRVFTFARAVLDTRNPFASDPAAIAPLLIAYRRDREADEESGILLGKIGYGPWTWGHDERWRANVAARFDIDTAKDPEASSVAIGPELIFQSQKIRSQGPDAYSLTGYWLTLSPRYETDGNGDRDVLSVSADLGLIGGKHLLYANRWLQPGGGRFRKDRSAFRWSPGLKLTCGDVRDDGGNPKLAAIRADGSYCRMHHAAEAVWVGPADHKLHWEVRLAYEGVHDMRRDWNRNYAELELSAGVEDSPVRFLLLYRRGRPEPAFEKTDELLLGFGVRR